MEIKLNSLLECPNCKSKSFIKLVQNVEFDNDLDIFSNDKKNLKKYHNVDFSLLKKSNFQICKNCLLVFSKNRRNEESMYSMEFFADVQKRWYNKFPPPQEYLETHENFSKNFFNVLNKNNITFNSSSEILWLRTECGLILDKLFSHIPKENIFPIEYFESNLRYLKSKGYENANLLSPGDFKSPYKDKKFDEIFINHQITHSYDPLNFLRTLVSLLKKNGRIFFYNEIDHVSANKLNFHYPRGINNFHNQLLTKNSLSNLGNSLNLRTVFFENLDPLKNASVNCGMFGYLEKENIAENKIKYTNDEITFEKEKNSFLDWMHEHRKFRRKKNISLYISFPLNLLKNLIKFLLNFYGKKT